MGKVYGPPDGFNTPSYRDFQDSKAYFEACDSYTTKLQEWARANNPSCPEAGELVSFPVADGAAQYVIASLKPVQLIHVDTGDAYQFQYANRLTAKDIRENLQQRNALDKLFKAKITNKE